MQPTIRSLLVSVLVVTPFLRAQEGPPAPSAELKAFEPLVGSWKGSGMVKEPSGDSKWTAEGVCKWVLGNFWLQEDFAITFEGNPDPIVIRSYFGWDAENKRYVNLAVNNSGEVKLGEVEMLPDGTMLQMTQQHQNGLTYTERSLFQVQGDKMTHQIDLLMPQGPSLTMVDGTFHRVDSTLSIAMPKNTFMGVPVHDSMQKFARWVGVYAVQGEMVMMPGAPAMKIRGTDTYTMIQAGSVLHAHTEGEADGMPGKYEAETFLAWDEKRGCTVAGMISNMGEVGLLEHRWAPEGQLVGTMTGLYQGQPILARSVLSLDGNGCPKGMVSHCMSGIAAPFENFKATYTKK
jgi:hypothetical protein